MRGGASLYSRRPAASVQHEGSSVGDGSGQCAQWSGAPVALIARPLAMPNDIGGRDAVYNFVGRASLAM